jgi:ribonuclease III
MTGQARDASLLALQDGLGITVPADLLDLALTHRSYAFENGGLPTNERLEFLGDSVLGLVITEELYTVHPQRSEGDLARMRSSIVNARSLAEVARVIGLGECILLGRGEVISGGHQKPSILADGVEAVLGAVYLAHGFVESQRVILQLFQPLLERAASLGAGLDWKTSLQEVASQKQLGVPEYQITHDGPDHARVFTATVVLGGEARGVGTGTSKKVAEQSAAQEAYRVLTTEN